MPARRVVALLLSVVALSGCGAGVDGDEEFEFREGRRVRLVSTTHEQVYAGTVEFLDRTVESIELELGLEPRADKIDIVLFAYYEDEAFFDYCPEGSLACYADGRIYALLNGFEYLRHELVHALVDTYGKPLFVEGLAAALDQTGGCLSKPDCVGVSVDALLLARTSLELAGLTGKRYDPAADLVDGMLRAYGFDAVVAFMADVERETLPAEVRSIYLEHFGASLDEDFLAFQRSTFDVDQFTPAQKGCDSLLEIDGDPEGATYWFEGEIDGESPEVLNLQTGSGEAGMVRRLVTIPPEQSGVFRVGATGESDGFNSVHLSYCAPPGFNQFSMPQTGNCAFTRSVDSGEVEALTLASGVYMMEWRAVPGATVTLNLEAECVFEEGGCGPGEQCTIWNECVPVVAEPSLVGEACEELEGVESCEAGARCVEGTCVAECDETRACGAGEACSKLRVCGSECDLLGQDCEAGLACIPTGDFNPLNDAGKGACVPTGELGLLETCEMTKSECGPGLVCGPVPFEDCDYYCCVPLCDASVDEAGGCELPFTQCAPQREGPVGVCEKVLYEE